MNVGHVPIFEKIQPRAAGDLRVIENPIRYAPDPNVSIVRKFLRQLWYRTRWSMWLTWNLKKSRRCLVCGPRTWYCT